MAGIGGIGKYWYRRRYIFKKASHMLQAINETFTNKQEQFPDRLISREEVITIDHRYFVI